LDLVIDLPPALDVRDGLEARAAPELRDDWEPRDAWDGWEREAELLRLCVLRFTEPDLAELDLLTLDLPLEPPREPPRLCESAKSGNTRENDKMIVISATKLR
jgi:hypothetical protein